MCFKVIIPPWLETLENILWKTHPHTFLLDVDCWEGFPEAGISSNMNWDLARQHSVSRYMVV